MEQEREGTRGREKREGVVGKNGGRCICLFVGCVWQGAEGGAPHVRSSGTSRRRWTRKALVVEAGRWERELEGRGRGDDAGVEEGWGKGWVVHEICP